MRYLEFYEVPRYWTVFVFEAGLKFSSFISKPLFAVRILIVERRINLFSTLLVNFSEQKRRE